MMRSVFRAALALLLALVHARAEARLRESVVDLPVVVSDAKGNPVAHTVKLTVFRDDARERAPFLILNHGRSASAALRAQQGRWRFSDNAAYFVGLGFAVFVPTRIGYGVTAGPDVEDSGPCRVKNYPPGYEAAARQSLAVIDYAKTRRYVDPRRGLVVGQSYGGTTAIALAAKNVPGVVGAVNFAGGGGGNPTTMPEQPCGNDKLAALFADYGRTARIPTLWLYAENDRYFGTAKPRAWFDGFVAAGGSGRFATLPAHGADGHSSFTANPAAWRPLFEEFLNGL